ncbi:MAG: TolC family protein [Bacteroidota bacterium]
MRGISILVLMLVFSGCVQLQPERDLELVQAEVIARTGYHFAYFNDTSEQALLRKHVRDLLRDSLEADEAVQIALANNRQLQAKYEAVGIAQADLVQAGLFENPVLGAHVGFPVSADHAPDLAFSVSFNFLDLFHAPLRKRIASSMLEETRLALTASVMAHTGQVLQAYYDVQAAMQVFDMLSQVSRGAEAAYEAAKLLHDAGNIPAIDLYAEQAFYEQSRLELLNAEVMVQQQREQLNQLMGIWGSDLMWKLPPMLPEPDGLLPELDETEQLAIEASIDLALAAQQIEVYAQKAGLVNATSLLPHLELGLDAEREESWEIGPEVEFPLPIFDTGAAKRARSAAEIRRQQAHYYALAVNVRAQARLLAQQLRTAYQSVEHIRQVLLPLRSRIASETQGQFNAMQVGLFQLLAARQQEILAGKQYLDALAQYWTVKTAYDLLLYGKLPASVKSTATNGASAPVERGH